MNGNSLNANKKTVRVQALVGELVHDVNGARVGRIRSIKAERKGDECVVSEYRLGGAALLSRLGLSALRLVGWKNHGEPLCVPWHQLDVNDPEEPRLLCTLAELKAMQKKDADKDQDKDSPSALSYGG